MIVIFQKTHAYHNLKDDVPETVKKQRLQELINTFHSIANQRNKRLIGSDQLVLVEKVSCLHISYSTCGVIIIAGF